MHACTRACKHVCVCVLVGEHVRGAGGRGCDGAAYGRPARVATEEMTKSGMGRAPGSPDT
jgi:hypothetical protein